MEIPKFVYHGSFVQDEVEGNPKRLVSDTRYVSTTTSEEWAYYFGLARREWLKEKPGRLIVYQINIEKLPEEVIKECLPPDQFDPRSERSTWFRDYEERTRPERLKIGEWRFPYIPFDCTTIIQETH